MPHNNQLASFDAHNRKGLVACGHFERNGCVLPGKALHLQLELRNPGKSKATNVKRIEVSLRQFVSIAGTPVAQEVFRHILPGILEWSGDHLPPQIFPLQIPDSLAPTSTYRSSELGLTVSVQYELKMEVKTHGFFKDFKVEMPVTIFSLGSPEAEDRWAKLSAPTPTAPPSYDSIAQNPMMF